MTPAKRKIEREDILPLAEFEAVREAKYAIVRALKQDRRVPVGPYATFYFECYETMWWQIQEMLRIEKGGDEQIADELDAYAPLVPDGGELVATLMIEIPDETRRRRELARLGGIETTIALRFGEHVVKAEPERDVERSTEQGKTSSVHFLHFPFTPAAREAFKAAGVEAVLEIAHENYAHMARLPEATRAALAKDLD